MDLRIILFVIFGVIPSLTWLSYYLRKDAHPESSRMVLKIFLWGVAITIPVFLAQLGLATILNKISLGIGLPNLENLIRLPLSQLTLPMLAVVSSYWIIAIALTEELLKYLVIRMKVINSSHLDEPLDLMLYMVIAALGFAALENILYLFTFDPLSINELVGRTLMISFIRFISATFLHTLCSATVGYFLALSFFELNRKKTFLLMTCGLILATFLHGLFNFSIMTMSGNLRLVVPAAILIFLGAFVFSSFNKLKNIKGVTIIKKIK